MQLARIGESGDLELLPEALERLRKFPINTKWVVVFGVGRGGKSTLCNLICRSGVFKTSDLSEPCTFGVWMSDLIQQSNGEWLVVVDSEGTEMGNTKYQYKLLALACLLACDGGVLVHNENHFGNSAVSTLAIVAHSMAMLKGLNLAQFPYLCFLVRNFELEVTVNGGGHNTIQTHQVWNYYNCI